MTQNYSRTMDIFLFIVVFLIQTQVHATHSQFGLEITETFITQTHFIDRYEGCFCYDETLNFVSASPGVSIDFENGLTGFFRGDLIWEHFFNGDETRGYLLNKSDGDFEFELSDAYINVKLQNISVQLGFQPIQFGNGFVFADHVLGAVAEYHKNNFSLELSGISVFDASPMVGLTAGYKLGLFENIEVFAIWFEDQDDVFKDTAGSILNDSPAAAGPIIAESLNQSTGNINWFGISASKFIGDVYFNFTGAYEQGNAVFYHNRGKTDLDISAYFFDAGIESNITDRLSLGIFCFFATGDGQPFRDGVSVFFSPFAYNPRASIFFDSNFMDRDDENNLVLGGATPLGVISPGIQLTFEPIKNLYVESKAITFFAQDTPSNVDAWYGWEIDLGLEYAHNNRYVLFAEAARFEHGDVLKQYFDFTDPPKPAVRFLIGGQFNFNQP